tara:strand:- start:66 stop:659 length:594 start_codon:yes stop_codon:yes gene_type:complete
MKDFHAEINRFIASHDKVGYSHSEMKKTMKKAGYSNNLINKVFKEYDLKHKSDKKSIKKSISKGNFFLKNKKLIIGFFVILVLILIIFGVILSLDSCNDKECFVQSANLCEKAVFTQVEKTITVNYETKDCVLIKKIIDLDNSEPKEVKDLFLNQEMSCNYEKGEFDSSFIESFSMNVVQCNGSLKDLIEQVRMLIQ